VAGYSVETGSGDLGNEAVAAEFDDESGDAFASPVGLVGVGRWTSVEAQCEVAVFEAVDGVLPPDRTARKRVRSPAEGVEPG
jgi:hypothetical protein